MQILTVGSLKRAESRVASLPELLLLCVITVNWTVIQRLYMLEFIQLATVFNNRTERA